MSTDPYRDNVAERTSELPVLRPAVVDDAESNQLPLQVHLQAEVDPDKQHLQIRTNTCQPIGRGRPKREAALHGVPASARAAGAR